jgi:hypothetical protein
MPNNIPERGPILQRSPLINFVGESGDTNATKPDETPLKPWHLDSAHQTAFDNMKKATTQDVLLAHPDCSKEFKGSIDNSTFQLGAVITTNNRLLAFSAGN